ncbi:MAG: hypothetical protein WBC73_02060 [Phormidesmis sp.]
MRSPIKLFTAFGLPFSSLNAYWQGHSRHLAAAAAFSSVSLGGALSGLGSVGATAAVAASPDYFSCASDMAAAGVPEAEAIAACAGARYPEKVGACVVDVSDLTGLSANSALLVCQRSRRPIAVANCTIDIHQILLDSPSTEVLENCGQSLLPERYGTCVIDIAEATEVGVDEALSQCIRAGYRPWRIQPRS